MKKNNNIQNQPERNKNTPASKQSGRSMVEMLGVLGIIGVLSIGGIKGYSMAMHKHNINKTMDWIAEAANNYYTFTAGHPAGDLITQAYDSTWIKQFIAPKEWTKNGNRAPMGVKMSFGASGTVTAQYFSVSLYDLDPSDCTDLVSFGATNYPLKSLWVNPQNKSFNGSLCTDDQGTNTCTTAINKLNSPAKAAKACKGKKNSILLMFKAY